MSKVLIIGAGPAGYTAAIYAARAGLETTLVAGAQPGGQLMITTDVENYPGFEDAITGPDLMAAMLGQASRVGANIIEDTITNVDMKPILAKGESGNEYAADALIIATGAKARWLGLPSEEEFQGRGVSACATCDGFFFRGQDVAVIGGGNTAVEEALFLSKMCKSVTLVHRRDSLRAEKIMQKRLFEKENINVLWDKTVDEITGDASGVSGLSLKCTKTGDISSIPLTGVFVAIGHSPETSLFKGKIDLDDEGYIKVDAGTVNTNLAGVFAAGDVADKKYRQAVTAAGMGCMAALEVEKFLEE